MKSVTEVAVGLDLEGHYYEVGVLALIKGRIYFEYSKDFLHSKLNLSPFKLPFKSTAISNDDGEFEGLFGLFNDALPDGWGRLLSDRYLRAQGIAPQSISALDRLVLNGNDSIGALVFKPHIKIDSSFDRDSAIDLLVLDQQMKNLLEGESEEVIEELLLLNGSSAGARPKALVQISDDKRSIIHHKEILQEGYTHWIVKFSNSGDSKYSGNIEYAYSLMAKEAGLQMQECHLFKLNENLSCFATKRFDREGDKRRHVHTLCGLLHSNFRVPVLDYDDLLSVCSALTKDVKETQKAFRLACFNVLSHNRDDHEKNVSFIMDAQGSWKLSPVYDLTFSSGPNGWQSLTVMGEGNKPGIKDLGKLALEHDIKEYKRVIEEVQCAIKKWSEFALVAHVPKTEAALIEDVLKKI